MVSLTGKAGKENETCACGHGSSRHRLAGCNRPGDHRSPSIPLCHPRGDAIHVVIPWSSRPRGPVGRQSPKNTNCWEVRQKDCCLGEPGVNWASLPPEGWDHTGSMPSYAPRKPHLLFRVAAKFLGLMILWSSLTLIPCLLWILFFTLSYNHGFILALLFEPIRKFAPFFFSHKNHSLKASVRMVEFVSDLGHRKLTA